MDTHRERIPAGLKKSSGDQSSAMIFTLILTVLGLWLMVSPQTLNYQGSLASEVSIFWGFCTTAFGFLLLLFSKFKILRWPAIGLGAFISVSPLFMLYESPTALVNHLICGLMITAFAMLSNQSLRLHQEHTIHTS